MYQLGQLITRTILPRTWNQIVIQQLGGAGGVGGVGAGVGGQAGGVGGGVGAAAEPAETLNDPTKGTIEFYQGKYMVVRHTLEVQKQVETLLNQMRIALGEQVSIEARFLIVGENFLEDLGVDVDITYDPGVKGQNLIQMDQSSTDITRPTETKVTGSLAGSGVAATITGGFGNALVDDLQVEFLIRATQAHRDSKILTAPKITVLSGETAAISVTTSKIIALPPIVGQTTYSTGLNATGQGTTQPQYFPIYTGPQLTVTPIISQDKKHVLLNITAVVQEFVKLDVYHIETPVVQGQPVVLPYDVWTPETETSTVQTRVSVPDGGTLLLGGLKITAEEEIEAGVPILSKIPILGRAFDNRSKIKDNKILLILVKPTIILQSEKDIEAISAMELPSSG
jgi:general secretion pathway protein D